MKKFKKRIPTMILVALLTTTVILFPFDIIFIVLTLISTSTITSKIMFRNKKSKLFGINRSNCITQKCGVAIIKGLFSNKKEKAKYFNVEMINLLLDMKLLQEYKTISQAIVFIGLKQLQKEGYIENLTHQKIEYSKVENLVVHFFINLGMGNFDDLLKTNDKYAIAFKRTNKEVELDFIERQLNGGYEVLKDKKGIKKLKFKKHLKEKAKQITKVIKQQPIKEDNNVMDTSVLKDIQEQREQLNNLKNSIIDQVIDKQEYEECCKIVNHSIPFSKRRRK